MITCAITKRQDFGLSSVKRWLSATIGVKKPDCKIRYERITKFNTGIYPDFLGVVGEVLIEQSRNILRGN